MKCWQRKVYLYLPFKIHMAWSFFMNINRVLFWKYKRKNEQYVRVTKTNSCRPGAFKMRHLFLFFIRKNNLNRHWNQADYDERGSVIGRTSYSVIIGTLFSSLISNLFHTTQWRDYGGEKGGTFPPTFFTFSVLLIKLITQRELWNRFCPPTFPFAMICPPTFRWQIPPLILRHTKCDP